MATEQYEDNIDLDDEIVDGDDDLDLEILDDDADVDYEDYDDDDDEDVVVELDEATEELHEDDEESSDAAPDAEEDEEEEDEEEEDEVVDLDDDDEEEDEETLEVLLGPDSETSTVTPRKRTDDSGDAPPGEGEFTCRSCFLVKRRPQLADADAMICLDCA